MLDGSRVHPETYEWARKIAVDALEIDDPADPTAALEEILQTPERLKDLDLDAFAEELLRQGFGNKTITLYDIRAELNYRYKDLRDPREALSGQQLFEMLIKDAKAYQKGWVVKALFGINFYHIKCAKSWSVPRNVVVREMAKFKYIKALKLNRLIA